MECINLTLIVIPAEAGIQSSIAICNARTGMDTQLDTGLRRYDA